MKRLLIFGALALTVFAGCLRQSRLPQGPQEVTGTLERVPLSLSRRGTHILRDDAGRDLTYVESTAVNLGALEKEKVTLLGVYQPNSARRELPVLVVEKVVKGGENTLKKRDLPRLGASIDLPALWEGNASGALVSFREPGNEWPVFEASTGSASMLPFDFQTFTARSGSTLRVTPIVLGLRRAASVLEEEDGMWTVYVDLAGSAAATAGRTNVLFLAFRLSEDEEIDPQIQRFQKIIRTLKITDKPRAAPPAAPSSGTGSVSGDGQPCGGPAGILCPSGYWCMITDSQISSGVCRKR